MTAYAVLGAAIIIALPLCGLIGLEAQRRYFEFMLRHDHETKFQFMTEVMEKKLEEFDTYKQKVDSLVMRAGFK